MTKERILAIKQEAARDRLLRKANWERLVARYALRPSQVVAAGGQYPEESQPLVDRELVNEAQRKRRELDRKLAADWLNMRGL